MGSSGGLTGFRPRLYNVEVRAADPPTASRPMTAESLQKFEVGQVYYGSLACAHGSFPVKCVRRTDKTVWFEHVTLPQAYAPAKSRVRDLGYGECAKFHGWYVSSSSVRDNGFDLNTI